MVARDANDPNLAIKTRSPSQIELVTSVTMDGLPDPSMVFDERHSVPAVRSWIRPRDSRLRSSGLHRLQQFADLARRVRH
jgi:hypothetical protein